MDELRFAMAIDPGTPYISLQHWQTAEEYTDDNDIIEGKVKHLSRELAEIQLHGNGRIVQFIHQPVNDFLIREGLRILDSS